MNGLHRVSVLIALPLLSVPLVGRAAPSGGTPNTGTTTISVNGTVTEIDQSVDFETIEWNSFDIGTGESVVFTLDNINGVTLNNIGGGSVSQILGTLESNGTLILSNPNGLFFGADSTVNVGSLVATTSTGSLNNDILTLNGDSGTNAITQAGSVNANGGTVAYFAPDISISGDINATDINLSNHTQGTVTFGGSSIGFDIDLDDADVSNQQGIEVGVNGDILSQGGYIELSSAALDTVISRAVNVEGLVSANAITVEDGDGGDIRLIADNSAVWVADGGEVIASSGTDSGTGGDITLVGKQVGVDTGGQVSADGVNGGGRVQVGGSLGGLETDQVYLAQGSGISASATGNGDGGTVEVDSLSNTQFYGSINADNAVLGNSGGQVVTRSEGQIWIIGEVSANTTALDTGSWTIAAGDMEIVETLSPGVDTNPVDGDEFNPVGVGSEILASSVVSSLNDSDVRVIASNDLVVDSPLSRFDSIADTTLSLQAGSGLSLNGNLNGGDNFSLALQAGSAIGYQGTSLAVDTLILDTPEFNTVSGSPLTMDVTSLITGADMQWNASSDLLLRDTEISSLAPDGTGRLEFDLNTNDLELGGVGQDDGASGMGELVFSRVNELTLTNNLVVSDETAELDLRNGVTSITLDNDISLFTSGGGVRLAPVEGNTHSMLVDNGNAGTGTIALGSLTNLAGLSVFTEGAVRLGNNIETGGSLSIDASQIIQETGSLTLEAGSSLSLSGTIEGAGAPGSFDLTLLAGTGNMNLDSIGVSERYGDIELNAGTGEIELGGTIRTGTLAVVAQTLNLDTDTLLDISTGSLDLGDVVVESADSSLSIVANQVELGEVNTEGLTVGGSLLYLTDDVDAGAGGIGFGNLSTLLLGQDTDLSVAGAGDLILVDNVLGGYGLTLNVAQGDVYLGEQNALTTLQYLVVNDTDASSGTLTLGNTLTTSDGIDLRDTGDIIGISGDAILSAGTGDLLLNGTQLDMANNSLTASSDTTITLGTLDNADIVTLNSQQTRLNGVIVASELNFSEAGELVLAGDSQLTGALDLGDDVQAVAINGPYELSIDNLGADLRLYDVGSSNALEAFSLVNAGTLELDNLTTSGSGGISLSGQQLLLTADTTFDTASANGTIDLSGIDVNGAYTLSLNAGGGGVSLGNIGQAQRLVSLDLIQASSLGLGGRISTDDAQIDFSQVFAIELTDDTELDTSANDGTIDLGTASIDGTFDLILNSGAGAIVLGEVGQNIALQSLVLNTGSDLTIDQNIMVIDELSIDANSLSLDKALSSSGGTVTANAEAGIAMTENASIEGREGITLVTQAGDLALGQLVSGVGLVSLTAVEGSVVNAIDDFVSLTDTSVNITAPEVEIRAGSGIGAGALQPIVLDVPTNGDIFLSLTEPVAYVVNLNGADITVTGGTVFDNQQGSQVAFNRESATLGAADAYWRAWAQADGMLWQEPSLLFAITQPGYEIPANVLLENDAISSDLPAVPGLVFDNGWTLRYPLRSAN